MIFYKLMFILVGTIFLLLGISNKTKKVRKGEKTSVGKVETFGLKYNDFFIATKYHAVIKQGLKKYVIEAYTMPWLKIGEEVAFQMTGKQRILGNDRLNDKAKLELFIGIVLIIFPIVMCFAK